jgi:hypothetical protein
MSPTAPFAGTISLIIMIISGVTWILGHFNVMVVADYSELAGWLFLLCALISLVLLLIIAPADVYAKDTKRLQDEIDALKPVNDFRNSQRGNEAKYLYAVVSRFDRLGNDKIRPDILIISTLLDVLRVEEVEVEIVLSGIGDVPASMIREPIEITGCTQTSLPLDYFCLPEEPQRKLQKLTEQKYFNGFVRLAFKINGRDKRIHIQTEPKDYPIW